MNEPQPSSSDAVAAVVKAAATAAPVSATPVSATAATAAAPASATLPADLFYWVVLPPDTPGVRSEKAYRAERVLPVNVDTLHQVWCRLPDGGRVMVAIEPDRLRHALINRTDITPATWSVVPASTPGHLPEAVEQLRPHLNCLHGAFEPAPRRRLRLATIAVGAAGFMLSAIALIAGMERHRDEYRQVATTVSERLQRQLQSSVPGDQTTPADLRLTMELRRLEASAALAPDGGLNAAHLLQKLCDRLPRDVRMQAESISVAADRISLRIRTVNLASAERIHQACAALAQGGLRLEPLQAQQAEGYAIAVVDLVRGQEKP